MRLYCVNCDKEVTAILTNGKEVYPHRQDLYSKQFWKCPNCGNYVGCHKDSKIPLGCIPTEELRRARVRLHSEMDVLWKNKIMQRTTLYKLISRELGYTFHNGQIKSIEECERVLRLVKDIKLGGIKNDV